MAKKYEVLFIQTETFIVDVLAESEEEAEEIAQKGFDEGNYQETGDCKAEVLRIYHITSTNDSFNPINE